MQRNPEYQDQFRQRKRREGLRSMEIWLGHSEIAMIEHVQAKLGLRSRSDTLRHILSTLPVTGDTQAAPASVTHK